MKQSKVKLITRRPPPSDLQIITLPKQKSSALEMYRPPNEVNPLTKPILLVARLQSSTIGAQSKRSLYAQVAVQ